MTRGEAALALLLLAVCALQAAQSYAPPHISFTVPPDGPDEGGYDVFVVGRNLGFLDDDVKVFVAGQRVQPAHVQVPWERIRIRMPRCPKCGIVPVTVRVGSELSEAHNFTMTSAAPLAAGASARRRAAHLPPHTDKCVGPVTPPDVQVLPTEFSGHENCTGARWPPPALPDRPAARLAPCPPPRRSLLHSSRPTQSASSSCT